MRPHVVILGAGASVAAIPKGDKNGNKSSVMDGLIDKLQLSDVLEETRLKTKSNNLEDIYSELYTRPECKDVCRELEKRIYDYFASLEIPDNPTVYDFLVLSLTRNDVIATFNWDPLLLQAYARCTRYTNNLPHIFCLHGNVAMGYCSEHVEYGMTNAQCPVCHKLLSPTKLLFPVSQKDYTNDDYIRKCWEATKAVIEEAYTITIFGYSAPNSDKDAVVLLQNAWKAMSNRELEEVSIIDIISEDDMLRKWDHFIYSHHYKYTNSYFESYLGLFPRRSCETIFATYFCNLFADTRKGFKEGMTWDDVTAIMEPLLHEELNTPEGKNYPPHYNSTR